MVSVNRVAWMIAMGNTYANLPLIKKAGFQWDNGGRMWRMNVEKHPMNNVKQRKKLEAMLTELEECGVRFVTYTIDGGIKS